jgi:USP8 dimerisation domain
MTSSHGNNLNIYTGTQTSQLLRGTSQPGPTRVHQNPTSVPTNLGQLDGLATIPSQLKGASRPHSIAELAERAKQSLGDESRPFKAWLRVAENARRDAKSFYELGDLESAFVEYAKAATIVLEKIPSHPDYRVLLSTTQRHNVGLVSYL